MGFMTRILLTFIAISGLIATPFLCAGGMLLHACHCDESTADPHEDECGTDPCTEYMAQSKSFGQTPGRQLFEMATAAGTIHGAVPPIVTREQAGLVAQLPAINTPLPASALPLLI